MRNDNITGNDTMYRIGITTNYNNTCVYFSKRVPILYRCIMFINDDTLPFYIKHVYNMKNRR